MGVISKSIFQGRSDRLAVQAHLAMEGFASGMSVGGGLHYTRVSGSDDYDVEDSYIDNSHTFDTTYGSGVIANISLFTNMINDDVTHTNGQGYDSLNAYLSGQDLNVHWEYDNLYYYIKGSHLMGGNVFGPPILMAYESVAGASSGVYNKVGVPRTTAWVVASPTNYAGEKLDIVVPLGSQITSVTTVYLHLTNENGDEVFETIVIPPTPTGIGQVVASTTGTKYIDCSNIQVISGGTNGDVFQVWTHLERTASL